jgi:hypothetical protein
MDEIFVETGRIEPEIQTLQDFSDSMGVLRAAENAMAQVIAANYHRQVGLCPSYRATRNEKTLALVLTPYENI